MVKSRSATAAQVALPAHGNVATVQIAMVAGKGVLREASRLQQRCRHRFHRGWDSDQTTSKIHRIPVSPPPDDLSWEAPPCVVRGASHNPPSFVSPGTFHSSLWA